MIFLYSEFYTPELLRAHPEIMFVFGDNGDREGKGGQAIIRDEPNTLGVATLPRLGKPAQDGDADMLALMAGDMVRVETVLATGVSVVIPITAEARISLGCGIANLPYHAPLLYMMLERWFEKLKEKHYVQAG